VQSGARTIRVGSSAQGLSVDRDDAAAGFAETRDEYFWKHLRNWSGSSRLNTRLKVSWFGTPFFNRRNLPRKSCLASAKTAISTAVRPPDNTAHSAIIKISRISYRRAPLDRGCGETHQLGLDLLLSKTEEE